MYVEGALVRAKVEGERPLNNGSNVCALLRI